MAFKDLVVGLVIVIVSLSSALYARGSTADVVDLHYSYDYTKSTPDSESELWQSLIDRFAVNFPHKSKEVDKYVDALLQDRFHIDKALRNMAPYLPWLLEQIDKRGLPAEVLIIPLIESCYEPHVTSRYGATGLWQIMPITAQHLDLKQSYGFQPRLDIALSTDGAMNFVEQLHKSFDKSWVLTLAAYNAGPSRVKAALKKIEYRHDMDFFKLDLPEQTLEYVPKILAFTQIIKQHHHYQIRLPNLGNFLQQVVIDKEVDFTTLALALDCSVSVLRKYNHQYPLKVVPRDSSYNLFIPNSYLKSGQKEFLKKLSHYREKPYYTVRPGDTLLKISSHFGVPIEKIMKDNNLRSTLLLSNQTLKINPVGLSLMQPYEYVVVKGDCLSKIAAKFGCSVKDLMQANNLSDSRIRVGQKILIEKRS